MGARQVVARRGIVIGVALALVAAAAVAVWWVRRDDASRFSAAVALAPSSADRLSWTDWAAVRAELDADVDVDSPAAEVEDFLLAAFDRDLNATTALESSATELQETFGFSPASIDWELFAQGSDGAVIILGLPESLSVDMLRDRLRAIGFSEPEAADGVWRGGVDLLERLDNPVTPQLAAISFDEDAGLLYGSDDPAYLSTVRDAARGDRDDGIAEAVAATGAALNASTYSGDYTCAELSMSEAGQSDRIRAAELVAAAGEVHPVTAFAIANQPGGQVEVVFTFETAEQARIDADTRSRLAAGPAPGQGGDFAERFTLGDVTALDRVVTMDLAPVDGWAVLSDFNQGPVLFATC